MVEPEDAGSEEAGGEAGVPADAIEAFEALEFVRLARSVTPDEDPA